MIQVSEIDDALSQRMAEYSPTACGSLDDARTLVRDAAKSIEKAGLPSEHHMAAIHIIALIENLEATVSEYAVQSAEAP